MFERWSMRLGVVVGVLVLGLAGCGSDDGGGESAGQASTVLEQSGGCGDAYFWAATAEEDVAVTVQVEARSRSDVEPTVIDFKLPDPEVTVEVQRGRALTQPLCNDVVDGTVHRVESQQAGVAGSGRITLSPRVMDERALDELPCGVNGELRLEGLVAEDGTRFDDIDIQTEGIGCYAG